MLTVRAPITAVLLTAAVVLALAAPASAGGPTSAFLSGPGEGKTASLYYTDPEYDQLADLVGANGPVLTGKIDKSGQDHASGPSVTVTWLIHDVQPWRVDHIYLKADGGPWISTQVMDPATGSIWDGEVRWHQPTSAKELAMLLDDLGVGEAAPTAGDFDGAADAPLPATEAPAAPEADDASPVGGVWWGLGGLVGGVLLALGWVRVRSTREEEPVGTDARDWLAPASRT